MSDPEIHTLVDRAAKAIARQVVVWRHHLHQYPELSNREVNTAAFVADHLRSIHLDEIRTGIAGHGVVGVLHGDRKSDRVMALRADIDALPVKDLSGVPFASTVVDRDYPGGPFPVSHACGHDCHTAMLMGAATVLAGLREHLAGTVLFVFQPAEEGPPVPERGGAREMVAQGAFDDPKPSMVFGLHVTPLPKGVVGYRVGNQYSASCLVRIVVTGQQIHGSSPWMGIDPMPAVGAILLGIGQLYRQVNAFHAITISMGHVEDVGRFNIIGQSVIVSGTIRCVLESDMTDVQQRLERLVNGSAAAYGCTAQTEFLLDVPPVYNHRGWVTVGLPTFKRVVGDAKVLETPPTLGCDDVSELVKRFGGLYVFLGAQDSAFSGDHLIPTTGGRGVFMNHHPRFYADDDTLLTGVRLHAHVAVDHLDGSLVPAPASASVVSAGV